MSYMMETTQQHLSLLGVKCPPLGADRRHETSAKYPFLDYDVLSDTEETSSNSRKSKSSYLMSTTDC